MRPILLLTDFLLHLYTSTYIYTYIYIYSLKSIASVVQLCILVYLVQVPSSCFLFLIQFSYELSCVFYFSTLSSGLSTFSCISRLHLLTTIRLAFAPVSIWNFLICIIFKIFRTAMISSIVLIYWLIFYRRRIIDMLRLLFILG